MSNATRPRWERRKEARPQELLAAALELFVERGYAATRLEDVAASAGVSKGTLYLYFANKEELFKAVVRENMLPILGEAEGIFGNHEGGSAQLLREVVLGWWKRIGDTKLSGITKLMIAESGNFPEIAKFYHDEFILRGHALIARILQRGIQRGEFRAVEVEQATQLVCAPVLMLMMWKHSFCNCSPTIVAPEAYLMNFVDVLLHGLLAESRQPWPEGNEHD